jgi:polar amino acid transport system substrate-binding protein
MLDNTASGRIVSDAADLKVAREFETGEQYGFAVKKDGNIPLLREINDVLTELREDGTYDEIYSTYFG